jgi:FPC/CPF motif-containing protein YcgG
MLHKVLKGHMMTGLIRLLVIGVAALTTISAAAEFSPQLEYELNHREHGAFVSALVILECPLDIRELDARLHADGAMLERRHREVLEALYYNAD